MCAWKSGWESDSDDCSEGDLPPTYYSEAAELARQLDLSKVHETVKYTETPFTIAAQRKSAPSKPYIGEQAAKGQGRTAQSSKATVATGSKRADTSAQNGGGSIRGGEELQKRRGPVAADPGLFVRDEPTRERGGKAGRGRWGASQRTNGGWQDSFGNPASGITVTSKPKRKEVKEKASVLDRLDASPTPVKRGRGRGRGRGGAAVGVKGRKKTADLDDEGERNGEGDMQPGPSKQGAGAAGSDPGVVKVGTAGKSDGKKISFHAFPAGLKPKGHPILEGLERQKLLPTKPKPINLDSPLFLRGSSASASSSDDDIIALLKRPKSPELVNSDELVELMAAETAAYKAAEEAKKKAAKEKAKAQRVKANGGIAGRKGKVKGVKDAGIDDELEKVIRQREERAKRRKEEVDELLPALEYPVKKKKDTGTHVDRFSESEEDGDLVRIEGSDEETERPNDTEDLIKGKQAVMSRYFSQQTSATKDDEDEDENDEIRGGVPSGRTTSNTTQLITPHSGSQVHDEDVPTMTKLTHTDPSAVTTDINDSSSALPYSSPTEHRGLQRQDSKLVHPRPNGDIINQKKYEKLARVAAELGKKAEEDGRAGNHRDLLGNNIITTKGQSSLHHSPLPASRASPALVLFARSKFRILNSILKRCPADISGHAVARPPASIARKRGRSPQQQIYRLPDVPVRQRSQMRDPRWRRSQEPENELDTVGQHAEEWSTLPSIKKHKNGYPSAQCQDDRNQATRLQAYSAVPSSYHGSKINTSSLNSRTAVTSTISDLPKKTALFTPSKPPPTITMATPKFRIATNRGTGQYGSAESSVKTGKDRFDVYKRDEGVYRVPTNAQDDGFQSVFNRYTDQAQDHQNGPQREWRNAGATESFSQGQSFAHSPQDHTCSRSTYPPPPIKARRLQSKTSYQPVTTIHGSKGSYTVPTEDDSSDSAYTYLDRPRYMIAQAAFYPAQMSANGRASIEGFSQNQVSIAGNGFITEGFGGNSYAGRDEGGYDGIEQGETYPTGECGVYVHKSDQGLVQNGWDDAVRLKGAAMYC